MSDNRIQGAGDKLAGSVKEGVGKLTGDHGLQAEGAAQKTGGSVQNAVGKVQDAVDHKTAEHREGHAEPKAFGDDRVEGAGHKLGGSLKEGAGKLTGDRDLQAEGTAEKTGGKVQNALGKVEDAVKGTLGGHR